MSGHAASERHPGRPAGRGPTLALSKTDAAEALGVSVHFSTEHAMHKAPVVAVAGDFFPSANSSAGSMRTPPVRSSRTGGWD